MNSPHRHDSLVATWYAALGVITLLCVVGAMLAPLSEIDPRVAARLFQLIGASNIGGVIGGFAVQHRLRTLVPVLDSHGDIARAINTYWAISVVAVFVGALGAVIATLVSGQYIHLGYLITFYGFAAFFFPTPKRLQEMYAMARVES